MASDFNTEQIIDLGEKWRKFALRSTPPEELGEYFTPEQLTEGLTPEQRTEGLTQDDLWRLLSQRLSTEEMSLFLQSRHKDTNG